MPASPHQTPNSLATLRGKVTDFQGRPVAWANVLFTGASPSHPDIAAVTGGDGSYQYSNLVPGDYTVLVNGEGFLSQTQQVKLLPGQTAQLDFRVSPTP